MKSSQTYIGTITSKGQVTVPVEIRCAFGLKAQDKLILRMVQGKVEVEPFPMTLEEAYGSVPPVTTPEDFQARRAAAREERVEWAAAKGK